MPETTLSFAKIVATPTSTSWSQSYNAGSLFVVISLAGDVSNEAGQTLNALGKEFLNTLEAEFFTLEEKSLTAIKQALTDSQAKVPSTVTLSLSLVFIKQNIVYGYAIGMGKITMRRNGQIGTILTNKESTPSPRDIATSSGILQAKDILVLQTQQFAAAITPEVLKQALDLTIPNDIAETLSVPINGTNEGAAAGIVLMFHGASETYVVDQKKADASSTATVPTEEKASMEPTPTEPPIDPAPPLPATPVTESVATPETMTEPTTETQPSSSETTPGVTEQAVANQETTMSNSEASTETATTTTPAPEMSTTPSLDQTLATTEPIQSAEPVTSTPTEPTATPPVTEPVATADIAAQPISEPQVSSEAIPVEAVVVEPKKFSLSFLSPLISKLHLPSITLTRRHKLGLLLLVIILIALGVGIYFSTRTEKKSVDTELFNKVYPEAQKDYEEGEGLLSLNKNLARDDFLAAQKKLQQLEGKYEAGSKEEQAISELKKKVDQQLQGASGIKQANTTEITDDKNALLAYAKKNPSTQLAEDESFIYAVSSKAVTRIDKGNDEDKSIITNDDDWKSVKGIAVYLNNLYVLDTENAVLKFVSSGSEYSSPSSYFPEDGTPDTEKAVSISIDGSIWLLSSDGTISKYTKGVSDSFKVIGLDTPFANPKKLVTNADMENLYILDAGNKRIVVLDKKGSYLSQVVSDTLASATEMTIDEKNKKAQFLSSGKVYEIAL